MSDNGDMQLVVKVERNAQGGLKCTFAEGINFEVASIAVRVLSLELDNKIISKMQAPKMIEVPKHQAMTLLDKMKGMNLGNVRRP